MTTTTIRIDDELKARVAAAAARAGKTAHAFILEAISQTVEQVEQQEAFHRVAEERWAKVATTGETVPWDDAKAWLEARSRGERLGKPVARKSTRRSGAWPATNAHTDGVIPTAPTIDPLPANDSAVYQRLDNPGNGQWLGRLV